MPSDKDYILGTHRDELERLRLQHHIWRPLVMESWKNAGITHGKKVIDVGSGPGFASVDLAEMVGKSGEVHAIERSGNFVEHLKKLSTDAGYDNIRTYETDLMTADFPAVEADAAWCRWVACFVSDPQLLVHKIGASLKKGGKAIFWEYSDYGSWKLSPKSVHHENFVAEVMRSWRETGGEPDIARELPAFLAEAGFKIQTIKPHVFCARNQDFVWQWPASFIEINANRMADLGRVSREWADAVVYDFKQAEKNPNAYFITPLVLEIIAEK